MRTRLITTLCLLAILCVFSCKKEISNPQKADNPALTLGTVSSLSTPQANFTLTPIAPNSVTVCQSIPVTIILTNNGGQASLGGASVTLREGTNDIPLTQNGSGNSISYTALIPSDGIGNNEVRTFTASFSLGANTNSVNFSVTVSGDPTLCSGDQIPPPCTTGFNGNLTIYESMCPDALWYEATYTLHVCPGDVINYPLKMQGGLTNGAVYQGYATTSPNSLVTVTSKLAGQGNTTITWSGIQASDIDADGNITLKVRFTKPTKAYTPGSQATGAWSIKDPTGTAIGGGYTSPLYFTTNTQSCL
jgi:hypothetical protein